MKLIKFETLSFLTDQQTSGDLDVSVDFDTVLMTYLDVNEKNIHLVLTTNLVQNRGEEKPFFIGHLKTASAFLIEDLDAIVKEKDDVYILPTNFINDLLMIAYHTSRGVFLSRGAGTLLESYILPLIEPSTVTGDSEYYEYPKIKPSDNS